MWSSGWLLSEEQNPRPSDRRRYLTYVLQNIKYCVTDWKMYHPKWSVTLVSLPLLVVLCSNSKDLVVHVRHWGLNMLWHTPLSDSWMSAHMIVRPFDDLFLNRWPDPYPLHRSCWFLQWTPGFRHFFHCFLCCFLRGQFSCSLYAQQWSPQLQDSLRIFAVTHLFVVVLVMYSSYYYNL